MYTCIKCVCIVSIIKYINLIKLENISVCREIKPRALDKPRKLSVLDPDPQH